tara:strand:+ start:1556 stop:2131 length:576 start_codon:yes stop_codon:yes gene_type:complete
VLALLSVLVPAAAPATEPAPFSFEGWVGEGRPVFTAVQPVRSRLYRERSARSAELGTCSLNAGGKLPFLSSFLVATSPLIIALDRDLERSVTWWGKLRLLTSSQYYDQGQQKTLSFSAGSSVELLMGRAEGYCLFRAGGEVFQAGCLDFPGVKSADGAAHDWWLQVQCGKASGWMLMDRLTLQLFKLERSG